MHYRLSCEQISALINFYAEESLSETLSRYVKEHLDTCPDCNKKYLKIKKIMDNYINIPENEDNKYNTQQYEIFKNNLSAYIDNELENHESIKIKKIAITNPLARQALEDMYTFKKIILNSYEKTKNNLKYDYSKNIICNMKNDCSVTLNSFYKIAAAFFAIIGILVLTLIVFLYF